MKWSVIGLSPGSHSCYYAENPLDDWDFELVGEALGYVPRLVGFLGGRLGEQRDLEVVIGCR